MRDRRTGPGGREMEMGDARNRSPPRRSLYHDNPPSPPYRSSRPSLSPPSSSRQGPWRKLSVERQRERDYVPRRSAFNDEGFDFQHKYMLPDHPTDLSNVGSSSSFGQTLVQKSVFLDDGSKHTFFSLPQEPRGPLSSVHLSSVENMRSIGGGSVSNRLTRYHERLRDLYGDSEKERAYLRDVSFPGIPTSQARPFVGTSLFSFSKESDLVGLYSDPMRRASLSPPPRVKPLDCVYDETVGKRGRDDCLYLPLDDPYHKMMYDHSDEFRNASIANFARERIDRVDASLQGDARVDYNDVKRAHADYVGSSETGYTEFGCRASRGHELLSYEESYEFGRDSALEDYRERANCPPLVAQRICRHGGSPFELDFYDPSPERMDKRKYVRIDDVVGKNDYRRTQSSSHGDEMWSNEEHDYIEDSRCFLPPKKPPFAHSKYREPFHKLSRNLSRNDKDRLTSLKKRLRPGSITWERKQDLGRPHKVWKRSQDDENSSLNGLAGDVLADSVYREKKDPPKDSEEFKLQILNAFFRFSKLLNETPSIQKMYRHDQGKSNNLLCCACGSLSKEFIDTHSLLAHSYHSLKVGLRTEHLGFHKALCVLNGWNWLVVPDAGKGYMRRLPSDIRALKEDLILWPPVVIIHNASIGNKNKGDGPKPVSIEKLGELLKEMGFGAGKTQVCRGKPANQSVLLVKFQPLFSGLQEAERLHKYYADNNRGKKAFQRIAFDSSSGVPSQAQTMKDEEFLYGYLAVAEDLDKLDPETKKRCLVKSKKDIKAIADAPLKTEQS